MSGKKETTTSSYLLLSLRKPFEYLRPFHFMRNFFYNLCLENSCHYLRGEMLVCALLPSSYLIHNPSFYLAVTYALQTQKVGTKCVPFSLEGHAQGWHSRASLSHCFPCVFVSVFLFSCRTCRCSRCSCCWFSL